MKTEQIYPIFIFYLIYTRKSASYIYIHVPENFPGNLFFLEPNDWTVIIQII